MTKLLTVVLSPIFWRSEHATRGIIEVYSAVFSNVIIEKGLSVGNNVIVKLYARDNEMMSILTALQYNWSVPNSVAEFEGRFLTVKFLHSGVK